MNITEVNKFLSFLLFCLAGCSAFSQIYIWGLSDNYHLEEDNPDFCYTYKIDGYWHQTYVYYEMVDKKKFDNRIEIVSKSYDKPLLCVLPLHIDQKDTLLFFTDDNKSCHLVLDSVPRYMSFDVCTRPDPKVYVPINKKEIPSKITILWGAGPYESKCILTIRSKKELDEKALRSIQRDVSEGKHPYHFDEYYYYISTE